MGSEGLPWEKMQLLLVASDSDLLVAFQNLKYASGAFETEC